MFLAAVIDIRISMNVCAYTTGMVLEVQGSFCVTPCLRIGKAVGNAGSSRKDTEASKGKQT